MSLLELFKLTFAFNRGNFQLSNGGWSDVYVDCRRITMDPKGLYEVTVGFQNLLRKHGLHPKYIGGVESSSIPITASMILGYNAQGFYIRRNARIHGLQRSIEGHLASMSDCIIVDDVATSGESLKLACDAVATLGTKVLAALVIVDREEGAKKMLAQMGVPLYSLLTLKELKDAL